MHILDATDLSAYRHTRKTLQIETGSTPKTVRSWIKKADITGETIDGTERFTDEQRSLILSHQSKRKQSEVVEVELIEPGAIELYQVEGNAATPLVNFDIRKIELQNSSSDTTALDAHTEQLRSIVGQNASAIATALTARFSAGVDQIVAEQDNLLQGIRAQALNGAAQSLSQGGK